ncbi:MAG TPA: COX15/CtaA family protein [Microvirga sp.]|nr:COX15/CtaA family protein [Microvirga sp.]
MAIAAEASLPLAPPARADAVKLVRAWIFVVAALVVAMVGVGGATRLTGSGLSITEWKPVTGALPPLSEAAWSAEFEKYRRIPQYELVNKGMTLAEFKTIYYWEWGHRQLGRALGLAFFLPLAWFWFRGALSGRLALLLTAVGALGGLQAAVGWIMVASGLEPGMTAVAPVKLMLHLVIASVIFACLVWTATGLGRPSSRADGKAARAPLVLLGLVLLQVALGGLVAGSKAGLSYNTWPLMDGALIPPASSLFVVTPWIENFVDNVALVQFNHRMVAYALVALAVWHAWSESRRARGTPRARRAAALAGLSLGQMALGIVTLVLVVPLWAGLAHQVFAMAVLGTAVAHARLSRS